MNLARSRHGGRNAVLVLLLAALLLPLVATGPAPAGAAVPTARIAGADRFATAAAVSGTTFGPDVPVVFVATGRAFADALAAGPAAARRRGPVLLVEPHSIPAATAEELTRLRPQEIVVVGGPFAVSHAVLAELDRYAAAGVRRLAGEDRYGTAAAVSRATFASAGTVYVAGGAGFADALAGAPAAHRAEAPMLLVTRSGLPAATSHELRRLGARRVVILGGRASVDGTAEHHLRNVVGDVTRVAGADRHTTATALSGQTFAPGVPTAYLATGSAYADALAAGPVAALGGGPILLVRGNCIPLGAVWELARLDPGRIVLLGGPAALGRGVERGSVCPYAGAPPRTPHVTPASTPAWDDAAPDPHLVRFGDDWYAYTTGTTWGNDLGVLTSAGPTSGWRTVTGRDHGSTALASVPSWQQAGTQWAPGAFEWRGRYVLFYAARARAHGKWCLSVATADTPRGPFTDRSTGPLVCQVDLGGSIDPHPFVDADGRPWLHWKNNDGSSPAVSRVWAAPLGPGGTTIAGPAREVLAKDTERYPWQLTLDNPQMALVGGVHYLFFTGGDWEQPSYATGYAVCAGPVGPCTSADEPIIRSYGTVAGPGGGTVEQGADGRWWLSYHAWHSSCTSDSCGGVRRLYVAPLEFR